jgi:Ca2+-binding RTX toxin-like protein
MGVHAVAIGDIKYFTIYEGGLKLQVEAIDLGGGKTQFNVKCLEGSGDVNAIWWSNGDTDVDGNVTLAKSDSALNMNGTKVTWDGYDYVSSAGLGSDGTNKFSFLTVNETLSPQVADVNWAEVTTLGIRATSVNGSGSIKGVDGVADSTTSFPTITIADVELTEGQTAVVSGTLSYSYPYPITVTFTVGGGTASNGDYTPPTPLSVVIPANTTTFSISIPTENDLLVEGTETFVVTLTSAVPDLPGDTDPTVALSDTATVTVLDNDTATWSISGDESVAEGGTATYTVSLDGTLQAGETATITLVLTDIDTSSADYASFVAAVEAAIVGRDDLSFDENTGVLTYTGDGNPMADLVIALETTDDALLENDEDFKVVLGDPDSGTGADIALDSAADEVTTTITDNDEAPPSGPPPAPPVNNGADPNDNDNKATQVTADVGTTGNDSGTARELNGTTGADTINGLAGNDDIYGGQGDDWLYGDDGGDSLFGGSGSDHLFGNAGNDSQLYGGAGNDHIEGNDGNDTLIGGYGADTLTGGAGNDTFKYLSTNDTGDTITDFKANGDVDKIDFSQLFGGTLGFVAGDSGNTVVANSVTWTEHGGNTIVSVDVTGDTTADLQITLTGTGLGLTAGDFVL